MKIRAILETETMDPDFRVPFLNGMPFDITESTFDRIVRYASGCTDVQQPDVIAMVIQHSLENQCLALSAMISKQDGFAIYSFLFQTPDTSNGAADALVNFAMNFTDGEANIKSINRISSNIMQITFTV